MLWLHLLGLPRTGPALLVPLLVGPAYAGAGRYADTPGETNPDPLDEAVTLRFAWPAGLACATTAKVTRTGNHPRTWTQSDRWTATAHPEGLLLHQEAVELVPVAPTALLAAEAGGLTTLLSAHVPDRVVGPDARFVRVEGLEAYRAAVTAAWEAELARLPERPADPPAVSTALDPRGLQRRLAAAWDAELGFWHDKKLPVGAGGMAFVVEPAPMLPGVPLQWTYTYRFDKEVPCDGGTCVQVSYQASVGRTDLEKALAASGRQVLPAGAATAETLILWADPKLKMSATLVVEPRTLVPHRLTRSFELTAEARIDGKSWFVGDIETRTAETTCRRP